MKESRHNSGTSLFLMEMILALLFLSLSSAACIQIFAAARKNRLQAEQWNQIQALTTSVAFLPCFLSSLCCVSVYLLCLLLEAPDPVLTQPDILWNRPKIITPAAQAPQKPFQKSVMIWSNTGKKLPMRPDIFP